MELEMKIMKKKLIYKHTNTSVQRANELLYIFYIFTVTHKYIYMPVAIRL